MAVNRKTKPKTEATKKKASKSAALKSKKANKLKQDQLPDEMNENLVREEVTPSIDDNCALERKSIAEAEKAESSEESINGEIQFVCFSLGDEEFAVDIQKVQEIIRFTEINVVPDSSPDLMGVINLRGRIIPVIDLRSRMGLNKIDSDRQTRVIVLDHNSSLTGIIVDDVTQVLRVNRAQIAPVPGRIVSHGEKFISGIYQNNDSLIMVIDLDRLLEQ